jgi:hypothetical protein
MIQKKVQEMPPLTDEEIEALCQVIRVARARWRRQAQQRREQK